MRELMESGRGHRWKFLAKPKAGVSLIAIRRGHFPIIYGRTDDGIPVTLLESWGVQLPNWPFPTGMTRYHSMWLIIGEFVNGCRIGSTRESTLDSTIWPGDVLGFTDLVSRAEKGVPGAPTVDSIKND